MISVQKMMPALPGREIALDDHAVNVDARGSPEKAGDRHNDSEAHVQALPRRDEADETEAGAGETKLDLRRAVRQR